MKTDKFPSCEVSGTGTINKDVLFRIAELSAEKVRIKTDAPIELKSTVSLDLSLDAGLIEIKINADGKVEKKTDGGYEILLINLSDEDRNEINELVKSSCDIE